MNRVNTNLSVLILIRGWSFLLVLWLSHPLFSAITQLPDLIRSGEQSLGINFSCTDDSYRSLGEKAFSIHGAFRLVDLAEADYRIQIAILSQPSVALRIYQKDRLIHQSKQSKASQYESFLSALDEAVEVTGRNQNLKGIFAGRFTFVGKRNSSQELYTSDFFFRRIQRLTSDRSLLTRAKWSPNGQQLAFTSFHNSGFPDLFEIDLVTGERSILAAFEGSNTGGVYSPSGDHIAMTLSVDGNSDLYILRRSDRLLRRVAKTRALESSPSWSPDGQRLVYASDVLGQPQLFTIYAQGGKQNRLKTQISRYCAEPDWNPLNPDLIAYTASIEGRFQIALHSIQRGQSIVLTSTVGGALEPSWMPDGRHLVFTERTGGQTRLVLLDTISQQTSPLHARDFGSASGADYVRPIN